MALIPSSSQRPPYTVPTFYPYDGLENRGGTDVDNSENKIVATDGQPITATDGQTIHAAP